MDAPPPGLAPYGTQTEAALLLFFYLFIIESDLNAMVQSGRNLIDVLQAGGQERVEVDSLALSDTHTR